MHADGLERTEPRIDYFATSLPNMLLFADDLEMRNRIMARLLRAQAFAGLGRTAEAEVHSEIHSGGRLQQYQSGGPA